MAPHPLIGLLFALVVAFPVTARAETDQVPPPPDRNPAQLDAPAAEKPVLPGDAPTVAWSDGEIAAAKADCAKVLAGVTLDYEPLPPIKEGICGAPAPILVKAVGSDPRVEIDPPATVTCKVAAGVSVWLSKTVQPKARALLGAPVVKLHNATSYACRNRYGGETTPLSEHALANALDISEFVFQSGRKVTVLASWEHAPVPPATDVAAETTGAVTPGQAARPKAENVIELTKASAKMNPFAVPTDAKTNPFVIPTGVAKAPPPLPPAEAKPPQPPSGSDAKSEFVRTVHDDACKIFGTVLGPEANDAHKNHFHLDMKARRHSAICE
jgi:hypothetical protein